LISVKACDPGAATSVSSVSGALGAGLAVLAAPDKVWSTCGADFPCIRRFNCFSGCGCMDPGNSVATSGFCPATVDWVKV